MYTKDITAKNQGDDMAKDDSHWLENASKEMKAKGTLGSFGKATDSKISGAKKKGGADKKKAIFAQNAKAASQKRSSGKKVAK